VSTSASVPRDFSGYPISSGFVQQPTPAIEYRSRFKRTVELWFDMPEPLSDFDVLVRRLAPAPSPRGRNIDFFNLHIDLARGEDQIFGAFARNTRAQINKSISADRFDFQCCDHPNSGDIHEFRAFYNQFAAEKGIAGISLSYLKACNDAGLLRLSSVSSLGIPLVRHAGIAFGNRVSVLYSASHFRNLESQERKTIGRANRRLHWEEMLFFRQRGVKIYDLGGWYEGSSDSQKLLINQFKEEFGGIRVHEFDVVENRSVRAKIVDKLRSTWG
jgi:hypothetical protein